MHRSWRLIVYELGWISMWKKQAYRRCCPQAEFRVFRFEHYPDFVSDLSTYSFKPLVIAEILLEHSAVIWLDTSIVFKDDKDGGDTLQNILTTVANDPQHLKMTLLLSSSHSIFHATNPRIYHYIPIDKTRAKHLKMFDAGVMLWLGTVETKLNLLQPWVRCASVKDCIAPSGSQMECDKVDRNYEYGNCHRYDQSAINLIAANLSDGQPKRYRVTNTPFKVKRRVKVWLRSWLDPEFLWC